MIFERKSLPDGGESYLVLDLEDLAGKRLPVCIYPREDRAKAVHHAEAKRTGQAS